MRSHRLIIGPHCRFSKNSLLEVDFQEFFIFNILIRKGIMQILLIMASDNIFLRLHRFHFFIVVTKSLILA